MIAVEEMLFVRETLARIEGKVDALGTQLATLTTDHATLTVRVVALEKAGDRAGDRRWALVPTWIGSGLAVVLATLPYLLHWT